jgi:DNA-binding transcriptional LysR family regulator
MNLHRFELFYYVCRHRGITAAARNMPYGIQAPAISKQMTAFEDDLGGHKLFERSPFRLTAVGELVSAQATQLIESVCSLVDELKHGRGVRLRVTSWEWVLQNQVSDVVTFLRRRDVNATFALPPSRQTQMESWLCDNMIDVAIGALSERMPYGVESESLLQLQLVLLVPRGKTYAHIKSADHFWSRPRIKEGLVCPPPTEVVGRTFLEGLDRRAVDWPVTLEAGSAAAVTKYVAASAPSFDPAARGAPGPPSILGARIVCGSRRPCAHAQGYHQDRRLLPRRRLHPKTLPRRELHARPVQLSSLALRKTSMTVVMLPGPSIARKWITTSWWAESVVCAWYLVKKATDEKAAGGSLPAASLTAATVLRAPSADRGFAQGVRA